MCGIAGIINFGNSPIEIHELENMAAVLAHRGPDDFGFTCDSQNHTFALAHRRLAVIDPQGGKQPFVSDDGNLSMSYNGECYDFRQLRNDLETLGHIFHTDCDTEVVLHLYQEYGQSCVDYIRGMFALAIWDKRNRSLFLARDRLGQKPLYYAAYNNRFIVASQPKAIIQTRDFPRRADITSLMHYLLLQYLPAPHSAFAGIKQLPPAHTMIINHQNYTDPTPRRYWSVPSGPTFTGSFNQAAEQVRAELAHAVNIRMIADVPLGAFLSGGIDSTIIVGLMSRHAETPIKTCTIGFSEDRYNELPYAQQAAQHFACDHHSKTVTHDCIPTIQKLLDYYDEPFADCSALPTLHLSQLARSRVTVALSGDGGDECFGGYDRYRAMRLAQRFNRSRLLSTIAKSGILQRLPSSEHRSRCHRLKRFVNALGMSPQHRYLKWVAVFDPDMLTELLADSAAKLSHDSNLWNRFAPYFPPESDPVAQAIYTDANTYLPGDLNTKVDRASMSVGLEVRAPFQDHKLLELAFSLPSAWRHSGKISKLILRKACDDLIPKQINKRPKMGFGVPVGKWFRTQLREFFIDNVLSTRALQRGYFHRKAIETLLAENDNRRCDHGHRLWSLLMLELWHQKYIDTNTS